MTRVSDANQVRLAKLREDWDAYQNKRALFEEEVRREIAERANLRFAADFQRICNQAARLSLSGVPARRIGNDGLGMKNYHTYMDIINRGKVRAEDDSSPSPEGVGSAEFRFSPGEFVVTLSDWGDDGLTGNAVFRLVDGEWMNEDIGNEVGNYVEQALFVRRDDEELLLRFNSSVPSD